MKAISSIILFAATLPMQAQAAGNCDPKQLVFDSLIARYGETAFASGTSISYAVKFYGNPQSGSWLIVAIKPDGMACVIAEGEGLEVMTLALADSAHTDLKAPNGKQ
jgi:hypothetical protein